MNKKLKILTALCALLTITSCSPVQGVSETSVTEEKGPNRVCCLGFTDHYFNEMDYVVQITEDNYESLYRSKSSIGKYTEIDIPRGNYFYVTLPSCDKETGSLINDTGNFSSFSFIGDLTTQNSVESDGNIFSPLLDSFINGDFTIDVLVIEKHKIVDTYLIYLDTSSGKIYCEPNYGIGFNPNDVNISSSAYSYFVKYSENRDGKIDSYTSTYKYRIRYNVIRNYATEIKFKEYDNNNVLLKEETKDLQTCIDYFKDHDTEYSYKNTYETTTDCQYVMVEKTLNDGTIERALINRNDKEKATISYLISDNEYGMNKLIDTISFKTAE